MKRIVLAIAILLTSFASVYAQDSTGGGGRRGGGGGEMRERMKQRLKTELSLTDAQTDSVMSIQQDFQRKTRELSRNSSMSADDVKAKTQELETARNQKLSSVLSADQAKKLEEMYDKMKKMREQRQGKGASNQ